MDIDSANFDPKRYVLNMLKQNTIKQLIRKNNEIEEEIKVHDHEIQSLVFENYSKFISSIDTVRQMKDNICMVDQKLKVLDASMDKISNLALKIDSTFKVKRKEIQKLDTVNKDLQKLKNLCDFPNILKQDLNDYKHANEAKMAQSFSEGQKLFSRTVSIYEECYKTLQDLKSEPLIQPIHKQSNAKLDEIKSILRARQIQFTKDHQSANALRAVTKNLIIISSQGQVSALRSYFHPWKERLIFKRKNQKFQENQKYDKNVPLPELINKSVIPEMNEEFWSQFLKEFSFIYDEVYNKLIMNEELSLLICNNIKEIFNWAVTNELQQIIQYSSSMKVYVHANHYVVKNLKQALNKISVGKDDAARNKLYVQLSQKLTQKVQRLGINMLNFLFGRLKLSFLEQLTQSKKNISTITISEDLLKQTYIKILGPIKESFKNNFQPILNDLQHIQSSHQHIFSSNENYEQAIHDQIESLIIFLGYSVSLTSQTITEEIYTQINKSEKLHKLEKAYIEHVVKDFYDSYERNGAWFAIAHNYLNYLNNQLGKKIIESAHKRIEISQSHNYANVFSFIKERLGTNLLNLIRFYTNKIEREFTSDNILSIVKQFVEIVNTIFPDYRRPILTKPSFLNENKNHSDVFALMTVGKLKIIEKQIIMERGHILTIFIRRLLKVVLGLIRTKKGCKESVTPQFIYFIIQICYEISSFEEESQIIPFYHLLLTEVRKPSASKEELNEEFMKARKKYFEPVSN